LPWGATWGAPTGHGGPARIAGSIPASRSRPSARRHAAPAILRARRPRRRLQFAIPMIVMGFEVIGEQVTAVSLD
jgi:hypothetical protein